MPPAGLNEPVLTYTPPPSPPSPGHEPSPDSNLPHDDPDPGISPDFSVPASPQFRISKITPTPAVAARAIPVLGCSHGTAARVDHTDSSFVHIAFFGWDHDTSPGVLEAFRHLPDECLGAIGLTLFRIHPPRIHTVDGVPISFDHTEFRDPAGRHVHAFKGLWISGPTIIRPDDDRRGFAASRRIRIQSALHRFRPAHARVAQGAVHRIQNPNAAWHAFQSAMLKDLKF